jgi:hypothetical protein
MKRAVRGGRRLSACRSRVRVAASASLLFVGGLTLSAVQGPAALAQAGGQGQGQARGQCARVKDHPQRGVPYWLERCGQVPPAGNPEANGRGVLGVLAPVFGLRADGRDLRLAEVKQGAAATHVRFQQLHDEVPVYLGSVLVKYDQAGTVQLVNNHTLPRLNVDVRPEITADQAIGLALATVAGSERLRAPTTTALVIYGEGISPTLAWHVIVNTAEPAGEWHVMVDADAGTVLAVWDELRHDTGSGRFYHPNAVQQTGNTGLRDNGDVTNATLDSARTELPLAHLDTGTKLKGAYVDVTSAAVAGCSLPYVPGTASEATRVYNYTRNDDRFEEATAYAAIDGTQSWFQALGVTNANNRPIPVDVHCIPDDNSFYSSGDGALHFGDGGVDDAEDADVIVHEYGHAVQDNQVPGWGPGNTTEQRAMGEGFADFLAGMYYLNTGDSGFLATYKYCIAEWDAVSYNPVVPGNAGSGCLRWINGRNESNGADIGTYGGVPVHVHDDGRFWSAALTCIYEGMGGNSTARDDVMKLVLAHHFDLVPDSSTTAFEDAVDALLLEDQGLFGGANQVVIASCAKQRLDIVTPIRPPSLPALVRGSTTWLMRTSLKSGDLPAFTYGTTPLVPIFGDWDGDGTKTVGTYEAGTFRLRNTNSAGLPEVTFNFGSDPRGFPVAGDFNGLGRDDVAVFRNGTWQIRYTETATTASFNWGAPGVWPSIVPVAGDWNGDGQDGIGLFAYNTPLAPAGTWTLRQTAGPGGTDIGPFTYTAGAGSYPVVGDWNADGIETVGVKLGTQWSLRNTNTAGAANITFSYGLGNDLPAVWQRPLL